MCHTPHKEDHRLFQRFFIKHFSNFFQRLAIKISLSLFVNKNESTNPPTVINITFSINIAHRELERVHFLIIMALESFYFGANVLACPTIYHSVMKNGLAVIVACPNFLTRSMSDN